MPKISLIRVKSTLLFVLLSVSVSESVDILKPCGPNSSCKISAHCFKVVKLVDDDIRCL